ncbi:MAG: TraB/GumN family protein [Desulfobacterales bacterium]|nr:TraB/GumN family protein [Desulfobacterales bacterium]
MQKNENEMVQRLNVNGKEIIIIGTAHISKESVLLVESVINEESPDSVCVEICPSRYKTIKQKDKWSEMDIVKVIKEKKSFVLFANLILASFQKRIAKKLDVKPGEEMIKAIDVAEEKGCHLQLADREISITLSRVWGIMGVWEKVKLLFQLVLSIGEAEDITEEEIEKLKQGDILESFLSEVGKSHPILKEILIDERDKYLSHKIKEAQGNKVVAVVGAGHLSGILKHINEDIDIKVLEELPPKKKASGLFKWLIPTLIVALIAFGFYKKGSGAGAQMVWWWIAANGFFAGIGALIALGSPLTILSAIVAAPITSLNPMIAAGWVSGLVEAFSRKPKVKDFENLSEDILTIKGFWRNNITRILLVVVLTNIGSSIGTFVAIPLMAKVL